MAAFVYHILLHILLISILSIKKEIRRKIWWRPMGNMSSCFTLSASFCLGFPIAWGDLGKSMRHCLQEMPGKKTWCASITLPWKANLPFSFKVYLFFFDLWFLVNKIQCCSVDLSHLHVGYCFSYWFICYIAESTSN